MSQCVVAQGADLRRRRRPRGDSALARPGLARAGSGGCGAVPHAASRAGRCRARGRPTATRRARSASPRPPGRRPSTGGPAARRTAPRRSSPRRSSCAGPAWSRTRRASRWRAPARAGPAPTVARSASSVAVIPPGTARSCPAAQAWQVSKQTPTSGWSSSAAKYGPRSSTVAASALPPPASARSAAGGRRPAARRAPAAAARAAGARAASYRSSPTAEPACTTTPGTAELRRRGPGCGRWRRSTARRSPRWGSRR